MFKAFQTLDCWIFLCFCFYFLSYDSLVKRLLKTNRWWCLLLFQLFSWLTGRVFEGRIDCIRKKDCSSRVFGRRRLGHALERTTWLWPTSPALGESIISQIRMKDWLGRLRWKLMRYCHENPFTTHIYSIIQEFDVRSLNCPPTHIRKHVTLREKKNNHHTSFRLFVAGYVNS